jgi:hypothetical protein
LLRDPLDLDHVRQRLDAVQQDRKLAEVVDPDRKKLRSASPVSGSVRVLAAYEYRYMPEPPADGLRTYSSRARSTDASAISRSTLERLRRTASSRPSPGLHSTPGVAQKDNAATEVHAQRPKIEQDDSAAAA